jgi:hypothetical protein
MFTSLLGDVGRRQRLDQVSQVVSLAALVQHEFMKLFRSKLLPGMAVLKYVYDVMIVSVVNIPTLNNRADVLSRAVDFLERGQNVYRYRESPPCHWHRDRVLKHR